MTQPWLRECPNFIDEDAILSRWSPALTGLGFVVMGVYHVPQGRGRMIWRDRQLLIEPYQGQELIAPPEVENRLAGIPRTGIPFMYWLTACADGHTGLIGVIATDPGYGIWCWAGLW